MTVRALIPNLLTMANISAGFLAVVATGHDRFELAVWLIVAAILLDMCDGRVARRLGVTSAFGQQLDSFSDAVSSGVAPAFLVQRAVLAPLGPVGVIASLVYLLAGVGRLTRFNLTANAHVKARQTVGVPIPVAAGYMLVLVVMRDQMPAWSAAIVAIVMAALMVSRLRLPELRGDDLVGLFMVCGIGAYFWLLLSPGWVPVAVWNGLCVLSLLTASWLERHKVA